MPEHGAKTESAGGGQRRRRRRKPRRGPAHPAETTASIIARVAEAKPILQDKPVEEPLTAEELAEIRQHLRFLRDHRRVLHLRVNAQEDLLLNEVREPTRRGVCLHLLSKVDRAHVFSAAERLEPRAAVRLAEGVLRISPNIDYLLLYLDCVRRAQSAPQAVLALSRALEHIDIRSLSPGQMRRVLDLLVELLEPRQLPLMLLGLLESAAFREALDASIAELPDALAELVLPLRAAQAVVLRKKPNRFGSDALTRGIRLLLDADAETLARRPLGVRRRLLELAIESGIATEETLKKPLIAVLESLGSDADANRLAMELCRGWIAAGRDKHARQLLQALLRADPDAERPRRWLDALELPRVGRTALLSAPKAKEQRRAPAVFLGAMRAASFFRLEPAELDLLESITVPGIAPVLDSGSDESGRSWVSVLRPGRRLPAVLERRRGADQKLLLAICAEGCRLLGALAVAGIRLPDARLGRFELDDTPRLWLTDLDGATRATREEAERGHASLSAIFCRSLFDLASDHLPPAGMLERLDACTSASECARMLSHDVI